MFHDIATIVTVGILACMSMDLWQQILKKFAGVPTTNWGIVGRWFMNSIKTQTMYHPTIDQESPVHRELAIGWLVHYTVSIMYSLLFWGLIKNSTLLNPTFLDGLIFGAISLIVPWFYFMPCMGKGVMGKLTANPLKACSISLSNHLIYGIAISLTFGVIL